MLIKGSLMIGYSKLEGMGDNFIRMVCLNPDNTKEDMLFILDELEELGRDIIV
jgi:hypothetical protein